MIIPIMSNVRVEDDELNIFILFFGLRISEVASHITVI